MRLTLWAIALCVSLLGASAVWAEPTVPVQPVNLSIDTSAPRADASITPLDHLEITVFREPDLSAEDVMVDESGHLELPLVGSILAAGKSTDELSDVIANRLREYVKTPQVAVTLKQAASRRVTVAGSVVQPGVYPIEGRLTLLQAVALARGPSQVASLDDTFIFRVHDGKRSVAKFDLNAIAKGKAPDPEVISGDTISIGSSGFKTAWRDVLNTVQSFNIFRVLP
ncbi:MAG TPA: polysaccharide biosynthesis/export family protein [Sphingomicrobium sp.]|nr:polysaccharide biosynthesis/export family protein [Sphingomicrobium sp.]